MDTATAPEGEPFLRDALTQHFGELTRNNLGAWSGHAEAVAE